MSVPDTKDPSAGLRCADSEVALRISGWGAGFGSRLKAHIQVALVNAGFPAAQVEAIEVMQLKPPELLAPLHTHVPAVEEPE